MSDNEPTLEYLSALCMALGVDRDSLTEAELAIIPEMEVNKTTVDQFKKQIKEGHDPLGDLFCSIRDAEERRPLGQTFTPGLIVQSMLSWTKNYPAPERIVDPGCGSGRYILTALKAFPGAHGIAAEIDPYAALMTRANATTLGVDSRLSILVGDYRSMALEPIEGKTLFLGNPPYVRHHNIHPDWKTWLTTEARQMGLKASKLAGLHAHFFLATALYARPGDFGAFITSSEWLDVNYGQLIRDLLVGPLSLSSLHIVDPTTLPFEGTTVTGTITCFLVGVSQPDVRIQKVQDLSELRELDGGFSISRKRLSETTRWSVITRVTPQIPEGFVELGELARVHRGTVTGANKFWVVPRGAVNLPKEVLFPSITRARELFAAGEELVETEALKTVVDLPVDLDVLSREDRRKVNAFLKAGKHEGVDQGYVARNRRAWWHVGLGAPAPILATYMARRPPTFVRNMAAARHLNIAHGIYPREQLTVTDLDILAAYLRVNSTLTGGRTYAGGLTKFEPREMERLVVPSLELLRDGNWNVAGSASALE